MIDTKLLDELAQKLAGAVPTGLQDFQKDLEKNFRAILTAAFAKLDLVTREEFEIQQAVLERTRAKLEALETHVSALEVEAKIRAQGEVEE